MGRRPETPRSSVEAMLRTLKNRSPRTITHYREHINTVITRLEYGKRNVLPWDINEFDIEWLLDDYETRRLTISTRKNYIVAIRAWTEFFGNRVISKMDLRWPHDTRPTVDWLEQEQAIALIQALKSPTADLVVHCELCLGMRRIEVLRLTQGDFRGNRVEILGKGSMGGKPRTMPYHRDTGRVLARYLSHRTHLIDEVTRTRPTAEIPDTLLIYRRGRNLCEYGDSGIDKILTTLGNQLGFSFSNHTLRRTFGRTMYRAGVEPAIIGKMLGHQNLTQTLAYIGVDLDDMTTAMEQFNL